MAKARSRRAAKPVQHATSALRALVARGMTEADRLLRTRLDISRYIVALIVILLVALELRFQSVALTVVADPLRADAGEYVMYSYNLKNFGVYSRTDTWSEHRETTVPIPDAVRVPLYPLFLTLFFGEQPTIEQLKLMLQVQALLSTLTVGISYLLARRFLSMPLALVAAALTALSPHLVTMNVYVLSETLFTFMLVLSLWLVTRLTDRHKPAYLIAAGATLGLTALTHPAALYLVVPLALLLAYHFRRGWSKAALLAAGFVIACSPWVGRNLITLGAPGDNTLALAALRVGAYRDMTYPNHPETRGFPYVSDPHYLESTRNLDSVMHALVQEFKEAPVAQLSWYAVGKPVALWSWEIVAGEGEFFVYLPLSTPYRYLAHFKMSATAMRVVHGPLVLLMLVGAILAWLPARRLSLPDSAVYAARVVSLLLFYHAAIMIVGFPEPRYSVPMRPFMYALALLPPALAIGRVKAYMLKKEEPANQRNRARKRAEP